MVNILYSERIGYAIFILSKSCKVVGSYEMVARCWNQGEGGRNNADADLYWRKVSGADPSTGCFVAPTTVINMILLFKLTFVTLMFLYMGSRVSSVLMKEFGGDGFKFTAAG